MNVPTIADDVLHCSIFPSVDADVAVLATQISRQVEQWLPNHIWHRDSFQLVFSKDIKGTLECTTRVGDSVDDEWLVVWLLFQITKEFSVVANVYDGDGEFLLIEAADVLPAWVTPENATNRVWISQGRLHLLPLSYVSPSTTKPKLRRQLNEQDRDLGSIFEHEHYISSEDAVKFVRDPLVNTQAPADVENVIFSRISKYPAAIPQHIHRTKAALPVDIAKALRANPSLIQRAVECFYTRDIFQLRATQKMARFPPSPSVTATVKMTRTAYAQLCGQRFNAPRVFKRPLGQTVEEERWWDTGVKIACGFEMLYREARARKEGLRENGSEEVSAAQLDALHRDSAYLKYISALENANYFEDQIRDSQQWKAKEREAAKMWLQIRRDDDAIRPSFADEVNGALASASAQLHTVDEGEDPDDWLEITQRDLERSLNTYTNTEVHNPAYANQDTSMEVDEEAEEEKAASGQAARLKRLAEKVDAFVEGKGDLSGAMFEDELSDGDDEQESDSDSDGEDEAAKRQAAMDALVAPLEPGEYGKMPPEYQYQNSQSIAPATMEPDLQSLVSSSSEILTPGAILSMDPPHKSFRKPIWKDRFDGVDSDDETSDEDGEGMGSDEEDEEGRPQVEGEVEIDMEQEQEDFLRFTREALGIDDQAWEKIISDREKRGAYVPKLSSTSQAKIPKSTQSNSKAQKEQGAQGPSAARFFDEIPNIATTTRAPRPLRTGPRPNANPELDSFEAVMEAMDKELERLKAGPVEILPKPTLASTQRETKSTLPKGKGKAFPQQTTEADDGDDGDEDMEDVEQQMDAELKAALKKDHEVVSSEDDDEIEDEPPMDYTMIKNFLESFKSQQGMAGPVSGLAGRLNGAEWLFPRDES